MQMDVEAEKDGLSPDESDAGLSPDESASAYTWKYFGIAAVDAKEGANKHVNCNFCQRNFTAC
jgi:hypothetical protein